MIFIFYFAGNNLLTFSLEITFLIFPLVSVFVTGHRDVRLWQTRTAQCITPQGPPTAKMFTRKLTHLTIMTTVRSADAETQSDMNRQREEFLESHWGDDEAIRFQTINYFEVNHLVTDDPHLPRLFQPYLYRTFAILGLSMPYRLLLFLSIGHIRYKIKKYVKNQNRQGEPEEQYSREFQLSSFQTMNINQDQPPDYETVVNGSV